MSKPATMTLVCCTVLGVTATLSAAADTVLDTHSASSTAREGVFILNAASAKIGEGKLVLSGVRGNVLAFETDVRPPVGVSELAERFLARWSTTEHSINPAAFLMSHSLTSDEAYRTLTLQIDQPVKNGLDEWIFEVGPMADQPRDFPTLSMELPDVTVTVVMSHSPQEFALGHVCGPWTPEALKGHAEVAESVAGDAR
ncbi:MAG: hypothetical protein ACO3IN_00040 [Steroidobacteraceae bacterium]